MKFLSYIAIFCFWSHSVNATTFGNENYKTPCERLAKAKAQEPNPFNSEAAPLDLPIPINVATTRKIDISFTSGLVTVQVNTNVLNSPEWLSAISKVSTNTYFTKGYELTLCRATFDTTPQITSFEAESTQLLTLERPFNQLESPQELCHGEFFLVLHINNTSRIGNHDQLFLNYDGRNNCTINVEVPPRFTLGILGDIHISQIGSNKTNEGTP